LDTIKIVEPEKVDLSQIEQNIDKINFELNSIEPKLLRLQKNIDNIPKVPNLTNDLSILESKFGNASLEFEKRLNSTNKDFTRFINSTEKRLNKLIADTNNELNNVEKRIPNLESHISNVHTVENNVAVLQSQVPQISDRVKVLEDYNPPPPTLQSVTTCESNTVCNVTFENPGTSFTTHGNVGIGTTTPTSRLSIYNVPDITNLLGEVNAIKINELAQINAYTKANAGLSSGRPGGIVFKTKRPNGDLRDSMTIDGNGSVTVGSSDAHNSAALSINSTCRGLLLPRLTSEQIQNIRKPEPGLMVYDTEKDTFVGYKKSGWTELC
jgi:archaellum component FlaC